MSNPTLEDALGEFYAGIFAKKVSEALKVACLGTIQTGKKGSLAIMLEFKQIGDSDSVKVKHTLKYLKPTKNGKVAEENTTTTAMYIDKDGYLSISPELQVDLLNADQSNKVSPIGVRNHG